MPYLRLKSSNVRFSENIPLSEASGHDWHRRVTMNATPDQSGGIRLKSGDLWDAELKGGPKDVDCDVQIVEVFEPRKPAESRMVFNTIDGTPHISIGVFLAPEGMERLISSLRSGRNLSSLDLEFPFDPAQQPIIDVAPILGSLIWNNVPEGASSLAHISGIQFSFDLVQSEKQNPSLSSPPIKKWIHYYAAAIILLLLANLLA